MGEKHTIRPTREMLCQSVICAGFGLPVSVRGILAERYALTVSDWAERTPTERNIERSVTPLRFTHMLWCPVILKCSFHSAYVK